MVDFLLASASPRRREILENLGFRFELIPAPEIKEELELNDNSMSPSEIAMNLACRKSMALDPGDDQIVLTADTVVALDEVAFGKPKSDDEARQFLKQLSGKKHEVITAIALRKGKTDPVTAIESTGVYFTNMTDDDIEWYISTGEPFGKAGGYAIQGLGGLFIHRIDGCYFNVVGLPVYRLFWLLSQFGYDYRDFFMVEGVEK